MKKVSLNIQSAVAMAFLLIFLLAAYTSIFGQGNHDPKKERTKVITLKVVEDENGTVKTIDTTFVYEGDGTMDEDFAQYNFNSGNSDVDSILKTINVWVDDENQVFNIKTCDSILMELNHDQNHLKCDQEHFIMMNKQMQESMKEMENDMKSFTYSFSIDEDTKGDSICKVVCIKSAEPGSLKDSCHFKHYTIKTGEGNFYIMGDENMEKTEGGDGKTIIVKTMPGGTSTLEYSKDTIIEKGDCKIYIKTKDLGEGGIQEKEVEVLKVVGGKANKDGDSTSVIVTMDGDNYTVKTIEKGQKIVMVTSCKSFENLNEKDEEALKNAGVKTKNNNLEIEDLKFAPNPSNGRFTLSFTLKEKKKVTINIYDLKGNLVYTETIKDFEGNYSKEIDISDQGTGAFFLQIVQGIYDIIKKIIIQ